MDPLLDTPALRALRAIRREGPVKMRHFTDACGQTPKHAKVLREKLAERGWIVVRERALKRITSDMAIELTARGRRIADFSARIEEASDSARQA